jgi:hypothetical protein
MIERRVIMSVLDFYRAMINDPAEFVNLEPGVIEIGPDLDEWAAIDITDGSGTTCVAHISYFAALIQELQGAEVDYRALRYALCAIVDQIIHGGP